MVWASRVGVRCRCFPVVRFGGWVLHAEGVLGVGVAQPLSDLSGWPPVGAQAVDVSDGYERLAGWGYEYGPAFRGLRALWRRGG